MEVTQKIKTRLTYLGKQIKEQPRLFAHYADCYLLLGNYKQAAKILTQGLEKFPNSAVGWLIKGNLHLKLNQKKLAYAAFRQALKINNDIPFAHERGVEMTEEEGDSERYIFHLRELRRLDPIDDGVQSRLDTGLLRKAAVEHGLYTEDRVIHISSKMLRRTLLEHNLIPDEIERKKERYFKDDSDALQPITETQDEMLSKATEYASEFISDKSEDEEELVSAWEKDESEEEEAVSGADEADEDSGTRESPLMKLLRGEMAERPSTKEVNFVREEETGSRKISSEDVERLKEKAAKPGIEKREMDEEELKKYEENQAHLSKIARQVTDSLGAEETETKSTEYKDDDIPSTQESAEKPMESTVVEPAEADLDESKSEPESTDIVTDTEVVEEKTEAKAEAVEKDDFEAKIPAESISVKSDEELLELISSKEKTSTTEMVADQDGNEETGIERETTEEAPPVVEKQSDDEIQLTPAWEKELIERKSQEDAFAIEETGETETSGEVKTADAADTEETEKQEPKGRVPTKTLAELYASQGDYRNAIEVYEELLAKHPTNQAYRKRLDELKASL